MVNHYWDGSRPARTACGNVLGDIVQYVSVSDPGLASCPDCCDAVPLDTPPVENLGGLYDDPVNHPSHYTQYPVEVIEITERLSFLMGNVVKYVLRADHKGKPLEDLKKARWYLDREIAKREPLDK